MPRDAMASYYAVKCLFCFLSCSPISEFRHFQRKKSANSNHKTRCYVQSVVDQLALVNDHLYSTALSSEILVS